MVRSDIRCGAIAVSVDPPTISRREKQTVQDERELVERGYVLRTGRRTPMVSRRFLCWDGEGATDANNDHHYILFGHSDGTYVKGWSLGSSDCLSFLIQQAIIHPDCIHFGLAYTPAGIDRGNRFLFPINDPASPRASLVESYSRHS